MFKNDYFTSCVRDTYFLAGYNDYMATNAAIS